MPTKKEWLAHIKERKAWEKKYAKETAALDKKVKKLPSGEIVVATSGLETPPKPPPNP